jgi:hypothetical protein
VYRKISENISTGTRWALLRGGGWRLLIKVDRRKEDIIEVVGPRPCGFESDESKSEFMESDG